MFVCWPRRLCCDPESNPEHVFASVTGREKPRGAGGGLSNVGCVRADACAVFTREVIKRGGGGGRKGERGGGREGGGGRESERGREIESARTREGEREGERENN
jgi:hypothetical protein